MKIATYGRLSDADFAAIDAKGEVAALIAPHAGHDSGHTASQARYPTAVSYAPEIALKQINQDGLRPFLSLAKLVTFQVEFREVPGTKKGGTMVNRVYLKVLCPDVQAVAQSVLEALVDDPVIVPAHGTPLVNSGDAERVRSLVEPFAK